ncbi:hypothetical protein QJQ45_014189 [Haematococcus lacustris]|nr:hypothetical protein QJQ45_014189 [Haematococcus lacustris]
MAGSSAAASRAARASRAGAVAAGRPSASSRRAVAGCDSCATDGQQQVSLGRVVCSASRGWGAGEGRAASGVGAQSAAGAGGGGGVRAEAVDRPSPTPPEPVSRYRSDFRDEQRLGKGGFGVVVSAVNVLDGLKYAIKQIRISGAPQGSQRLLREVNLLSRLQHPNVAVAEGAGQPIGPTGGVRFATSRLGRRPLTPSRAALGGSGAWGDETEEEEGGEWGDLGDTDTATDTATITTSTTTALSTSGRHSFGGLGSHLGLHYHRLLGAGHSSSLPPRFGE